MQYINRYRGSTTRISPSLNGKWHSEAVTEGFNSAARGRETEPCRAVCPHTAEKKEPTLPRRLRLLFEANPDVHYLVCELKCGFLRSCADIVFHILAELREVHVYAPNLFVVLDNIACVVG